MAVERTLSIIKPDATRRNITGKVIDRLEQAGLRIVAQRRIRLTKERAEAFYEVHRERPFGQYPRFEHILFGPPTVTEQAVAHR